MIQKKEVLFVEFSVDFFSLVLKPEWWFRIQGFYRRKTYLT